MRRFFTAVLLVTALLAGACGDDDGGSATPPAGDDSTTATDTSTDPDTGDGAEGAGEVAAIDISALDDWECLAIGNALTGVISRGIIRDFDEDLATFRAFAAGAPAATQAAFATFLDAYEASYRMLDEAGVALNSAESVQANHDIVRAAKELIDAPDVEAALDTVDDAYLEACPMMRDE